MPLIVISSLSMWVIGLAQFSQIHKQFSLVRRINVVGDGFNVPEAGKYVYCLRDYENLKIPIEVLKPILPLFRQKQPELSLKEFLNPEKDSSHPHT